MKITKDQLLVYLRNLRNLRDIEKAHSDADNALLAYIDDVEIMKAYVDIPRWYA